MPNNYTITIGSGGSLSNSDLSCNPGDKISWYNNSGESITSFTLPTCVQPQTVSVPIANGTTIGPYTVNSGSRGNYSYSFTLPSITHDTKSGTIDVS